MLENFVGTIWRKITPFARRKIIRATQQKFTVSVAAIVINEKGEVLLLDHVLRSAHATWGIPGGFMEMSEQPEQAVRREIREETGLELENVKLFEVRTNSRHIEIVFRASATGKAEAKSREIKAAAWFKVDELPADMSKKQKSDVQKLLQPEPNNFR
jgi:mutator protein MutT